MLADVLIWGGYIALFIWLSRKGSGHDVMVSGRVGFGILNFGAGGEAARKEFRCTPLLIR